MTQRQRFGNFVDKFPPGTAPVPSIARNTIVITSDANQTELNADRAEAAADAAEASAAIAQQSILDAQEQAQHAQDFATAAAQSVADAAGYAAAAADSAALLANPDYGFFHDVPTDDADYGTPWV